MLRLRTVFVVCFADADDKSKFEEKLVSMPMSEVTYLLTTFANMARSCSSSEPHFIETVALEIFEVFYDVQR